MAARPIYDEELNRLNSELIEMADLVKNALESSFEVVTEQNVEKAARIARRDELVNEKERSIETLCMRLILREQPVASDMRMITAALKMVTDLERIGDQASEICILCATLPAGTDLSVFSTLAPLSRAVCCQLENTIDAFVAADLDKVRECMKGDETVDDLYERTKSDILAHIVEHRGDENAALDVFMIAKYLERAGDHAVNIAEWSEYALTGIHKGHAFYGEEQ